MFYPIIVIICYIIVTLVKRTSLAKEWLPLLSGCTGVLLAILGFYALPQFAASDTILAAAFNGAVSGLAATGGNQVFKQAVKLFCKRHGLDYDKLDQLLPDDGAQESDGTQEQTEAQAVSTPAGISDPLSDTADCSATVENEIPILGAR